MEKGFWAAKGGGRLSDGKTAYDNSSRTEPKRSHQWFAAAESELFPNKKQALQAPNVGVTTGIFNPNAPHWENSSSFQAVPNQFIGRLFGSEPNGTANFAERNISPAGTDNSNVRNKGISEQFGIDSPIGFSVSPSLEDPETCLSYGGIRKVKVNQVKDANNGQLEPKEHNSGNETSFTLTGQAYSKEDENVVLMGHAYNRSMVSASEEGMHNKGETNIASFGGFSAEGNMDLLAQPISSYELLYGQYSVQTPETPSKKKSDSSVANTPNTVASASAPVSKPKPESVSKNKLEVKLGKKDAPNSFPSNVKSLMSTGMLDGVPVKYVSTSRELRGIINGSGYRCGCESCNYSKVLNAYEFERHAGNSKTKHPNNHIQFENGKTIYQIVQELKSTPESMLFDVVQTVTGSPINQKAFRSWKESFQAASRELQRIYGKEELNL